MTEIRKPPPRPFETAAAGTCKMCGKRCNASAEMHIQCRIDYQFTRSPTFARNYLFTIDQGRCRQCGHDTTRYETEHLGQPLKVALDVPDLLKQCERLIKGGKNKSLAKTLNLGRWHLDHVIPLWKVPKGVEPLRYWMPANAQTLCDACHERKTSAEASERAHFNRLAAKRNGKTRSRIRRKVSGEVVDTRRKPVPF